MDSFNKCFIDVIKNHYFDFNGRATRTQYWMFQLFYLVFGVLLMMLSVILGAIKLGFIVPILMVIVGFGILLPGLGIAVRRLHDINKSGWFLLLNLIPFGGLVILYFLVLPSDQGDNNFGAPSFG